MNEKTIPQRMNDREWEKKPRNLKTLKKNDKKTIDYANTHTHTHTHKLGNKVGYN